MGFYHADYFEQLSPFFAKLRGHHSFERALSNARVRRSEFAAAVGRQRGARARRFASLPDTAA